MLYTECMKKCSICKQLFDLSSFNKKKSSKDGLQTACRQCNREKSRRYYAENKNLHKQKVFEYNKKYKLEAKKFIYNFLLENPCIECGESDPCALDFDHISDKEINISSAVTRGWSIERISKEIEKCIVRCANCHRKKTAKDFNWYKDLGV